MVARKLGQTAKDDERGIKNNMNVCDVRGG
jgi:hypothetical protein